MTSRVAERLERLFGFGPQVALEDLLEPSIAERFVLFRNHGDNTLRDILPALQLKRRFVDRLGNHKLDEPDDIERFLASVREGVRSHRMEADMV